MITDFTTLGMLGKMPIFFKMLTSLEMSSEDLTPKKMLGNLGAMDPSQALRASWQEWATKICFAQSYYSGLI